MKISNDLLVDPALTLEEAIEAKNDWQEIALALAEFTFDGRLISAIENKDLPRARRNIDRIFAEMGGLE